MTNKTKKKIVLPIWVKVLIGALGATAIGYLMQKFPWLKELLENIQV